MKNILFFILFPVLAYSQTGEPTVDSTTYEAAGGGLFRKVIFLTYPDGYEQVVKQPPITAAQVTANEQNAFTQSALSMAQDAAYVSTFPKKITEINRLNNAIKSIVGVSPLDSLQALQVTPFLVAGWTLRVDGVLKPMVFTVNAAGNLRHKVDTDPVKGTILLPGVLRLNDYPASGQKVDLFRLTNGNFVSLNRTYILRRPGSTQNSVRDVDAAPEVEILAPVKKKKKG